MSSDWEKVVPKPRSQFLRVKCPDCGSEQIIYSAAAKAVPCNTCGRVLAEPTGGKAEVKGEVGEAFS